ncbi:hypothetical protein N9Z27_02670 [Alphaproteobacteria bacterium]|nr:hypothetical protein [Alphaproteobacteria bacterium]
MLNSLGHETTGGFKFRCEFQENGEYYVAEVKAIIGDENYGFTHILSPDSCGRTTHAGIVYNRDIKQISASKTNHYKFGGFLDRRSDFVRAVRAHFILDHISPEIAKQLETMINPQLSNPPASSTDHQPGP